MTKATEIAAIRSVFDDPEYEEWSEERAAEKIRTAFLNVWKGSIREPSPALHLGMRFKYPWDPKTRHVSFLSSSRIWVTEASSRFGALIPTDASVWEYVSRVSDRFMDVVDEEGNKTGERVQIIPAGGPGPNADGWRIGQVVSHTRGLHRFTIVQTHEKCVLMMDGNTRLSAEPNDIMERFFERVGK